MEKRVFPFFTGAETACLAIGSDNTMAWNKDGERIGRHRPSDRPDRLRPAYHLGKLSITHPFAINNPKQIPVTFKLERRETIKIYLFKRW